MNIRCPRSTSTVGVALLSSTLLAGCAAQGYSVIAATSTTIGVGLSQQPTNGSLDATLGYKRAELAFVPTNRSSGENAGSVGGGAKDSGNVIMELRYSGMFSTGADSGIYQRLAVGDVAVRENGTALLFAKGPDGKIDPEAAKALNAVVSIRAAGSEAAAAKVPLAKKYQSYQRVGDAVGVTKFNDAAVSLQFKNFDSFLLDPNTTPQQVKVIRENLGAAGIAFD